MSLSLSTHRGPVTPMGARDSNLLNLLVRDISEFLLQLFFISFSPIFRQSILVFGFLCRRSFRPSLCLIDSYNFVTYILIIQLMVHELFANVQWLLLFHPQALRFSFLSKFARLPIVAIAFFFF